MTYTDPELAQAGLTEAELRHLMHREWARTADDVIWRRSNLGLRLNDDQKQRLQARMEEIAAGEGQRAAE